MKRSTVLKLNQFNQDFYSTYSQSFDQSRAHPWQGWGKLVGPFQSLVATTGPLTVLDLGCGNGRFASWLAESKIAVKSYTGVDLNQELLAAARQRTDQLPFAKAFKKIDLVLALLNEERIAQGQFDVVAIYGVLHHLPSYQLRNKLINTAADLLSDKGLLAFSNWDFQTLPGLMKRAKPLVDLEIVPDPEPGDYLLDWQRPADANSTSADPATIPTQPTNRFCHLVDPNEVSDWLSESGLVEELRYNDDGPAGKTNQYFVWRR